MHGSELESTWPISNGHLLVAFLTAVMGECEFTVPPFWFFKRKCESGGVVFGKIFCFF